MVAWKNYILLMGGFQDTSTSPKYLSDLWAFDTVNYTWTLISLPAHAQRPEARSSFSLLPHESGAVIYGGYSRVKASAATGGTSNKKSGKPAGSSRSVTYKPIMYQDTWLLRMDPDLTKVRWERRKKPGNLPNPARVGVTMAWHKGRGILFGGVRDEEDSEESLDSEFFNDLFAWGAERNRFFPLVLRKPRMQQKRVAERGGGRRDRAKEDEEELLKNLAALEATGKMASEATDLKVEMDIDVVEKKTPVELSLELPHKRFNCVMAVLDDVLYGYGGTFEKGDREFMFDEMFSIDLGRLDGVRYVPLILMLSLMLTVTLRTKEQYFRGKTRPSGKIVKTMTMMTMTRKMTMKTKWTSMKRKKRQKRSLSTKTRLRHGERRKQR